MRRYLEKFKYGNARTGDLWAVLGYVHSGFFFLAEAVGCWRAARVCL